MKKVVNAIILGLDKKTVLLIKRKSDDSIHASKWAFPGGRVEEKESEDQALIREIKEEVNLDIEKIIKKIGSYEYSGKNKEKISGESYLVNSSNLKVIINKKEVEDFKWATVEEIKKLNCVPGILEETTKALLA